MLSQGDGMQSEPFSEPVTVYLEHPDGVVRLTALASTREAYKALLSAGRTDIANPAWQVAMDATVRALLDPKPDKIEASRLALERLANLRASVDPHGRRTFH